MTGSCYCHVHSSLVYQKSKALLFGNEEVGSDAVEDYDVFFSSLKCINRVDFNIS